MKKILCGILITLLSASFCACGGKEDKKESTTVSAIETTSEDVAGNDDADVTTAQQIADAILSGGEFKDTLAAIDQSMAATRLYTLDEAQIADSAFYTNSNATAEEIAVIKVTDESYVEAVKTAFSKRVSDQRTACQDYLPDEITKLDSAVIYTSGTYVILVVSCDSAKVNAVIEDLF